MSDDESSDVLRERFQNRASGSDGSDNADETGETGTASETDDAGETPAAQETASADEETVRERKQEAMYLRPAQRDRLREFYDELDGRSKVAGEGGLAKNDDFYEAVVAFVIDERREEFIEYLGLGGL